MQLSYIAALPALQKSKTKYQKSKIRAGNTGGGDELGIDGYLEPFYPEKHKRHFLTHLQKLYWQDVYGHTRRDNWGKRFAKGFIQLNFGGQ